MEKEWVQYHVVNVDLIKEYKVPGGKMSAQVAHGSTIVAVKHGNEPNFVEWFAEGKKQKKIVLRGKEKDLKKFIEMGAYPVYDNGHNWIPEGSLTEVVFPIMEKDAAPKLLKKMQVYKGDEYL